MLVPHVRRTYSILLHHIAYTTLHFSHTKQFSYTQEFYRRAAINSATILSVHKSVLLHRIYLFFDIRVECTLFACFLCIHVCWCASASASASGAAPYSVSANRGTIIDAKIRRQRVVVVVVAVSNRKNQAWHIL